MTNTNEEILNPIEIMEGYGWKIPHVTFDSNLQKGRDSEGCEVHEIVRRSAHDGTLAFTIELLQISLIDLANKDLVCKEWKINIENLLRDIHYTIGNIHLVSTSGMVELPAGNFPGVIQEVRIPVKIKYITL